MSKKKVIPVVQALKALQTDPDSHVHLHINTERKPGMVVRFPTPVVADKQGAAVKHPEEAEFDRNAYGEFGRTLLAVGC